MNALDDAGRILAAAREQGLHPVASSARLDLSGADFVVAHVVDEEGTRWVLRAPRRPDVVERAARERRALALVAPRLPVAVPEWRICSPELIAYPRLDGEPCAVVDLAAGGYAWRFDAAAPPPVFLRTVAEAVAALHAITPDDARGAGLPVRTPGQVREEHAARVERAREVLDVPETVRRAWHAWLADDSYWPGHTVPVHGDLHPPHVLVDDAHRVVGLLDWTEAHVGDPATDFALMHAALGRSALAAMVERYRAAGGRTWPRMEEHVVQTWRAYPAVLADFARVSGEEGPRALAQHLVHASARELDA